MSQSDAKDGIALKMLSLMAKDSQQTNAPRSRGRDNRAIQPGKETVWARTRATSRQQGGSRLNGNASAPSANKQPRQSKRVQLGYGSTGGIGNEGYQDVMARGVPTGRLPAGRKIESRE